MRPLLRLVARITVTALVVASTTLIAPAAHALPVYTESDSDTGSNATNSSPTLCSVADSAVPGVSNNPVAENGPSTTSTTGVFGTVTNDGDGTDTISFQATVSGTAKLTSTAGHPTSLSLVADGTVSASTSKPVSACRVDAYAYVDLDYTFTLTQPGFLTITSKASNNSYGEFYIENDDDDNDYYFDVYGEGNAFSGVNTVFLPAGTYTGYLEGDADILANKTVASTPTKVSVQARFDVAGSRTSAPVGAAKKYVALPSARSCSTDSLDAKVTSGKNKAKKIKQVKLFVNGRLVKKVNKPAKGATVKAPVADDTAAALRAVVTEVKKPNGKPGKTYEIAASYAPCA